MKKWKLISYQFILKNRAIELFATSSCDQLRIVATSRVGEFQNCGATSRGGAIQGIGMSLSRWIPRTQSYLLFHSLNVCINAKYVGEQLVYASNFSDRHLLTSFQLWKSSWLITLVIKLFRCEALGPGGISWFICWDDLHKWLDIIMILFI